MRFLAVIPARGGSKRLPRKNLAMLNGRTLLDWSIMVASESGLFTSICVSTDDAQIRAEASRWPQVVIIDRPAALARDESPTLDVLQHALSIYGGWRLTFDAVFTLQPTSPLRSLQDLHRVATALNRDGVESVFTANVAPDGEGVNVFPNGAIYATTPKMLADGFIYEPHSAIVPMPRERGVDIDTIEDLDLARKTLWRMGAA